MSNYSTNLSSAARRIRRISDPSYPLCREDIIWVLHYVHKKVALKDPLLLDLSKPRLLKNFSSYCEAALLLHSSGNHFHAKNADIRTTLLDAMYGLPELEDALSPIQDHTIDSQILENGNHATPKEPS
ncbi:hypothetical protein [Paenibacillus solani]|uniref:hypothetical protein n=1 Tax=Paenibacillus solani TaxID=1705565 RepID=UPI003D26B312